jgi:phage terminase small subunit
LAHPTDGLPEPPRQRTVKRFAPIVRYDRNGTTADERNFAKQYLIDLSPELAAERAGLSPTSGRYLLREPRVQDEIARERNARIGRTRIYADEVLTRWWMLATADPRELVSLRRVCCRYCYGLDHRYQFTQNELERERVKHRELMMALPEQDRFMFDDLGGDGYDPRKRAVAECPECFGEGTVTYYVEDSDNYSPAAALLFDGIKIGRNGEIEIKLRDRGEALSKVAQFLGLLVQRHAVMTVDPSKLTNEQLEDAIAQFESLVAQKSENVAVGDMPTPLGDDGAIPVPNGGIEVNGVRRSLDRDGNEG